MSKKILLAPDSFKGSMTAKEVCDAMEKGIRNYLPNAEIIKVPMADGGEGTVQSLVDATKGKIIEKVVTGPLNEPVTAKYGLLGDGKTAVIEMAEASGIGYVNEETKNPLVTTTYGTGELILDCIENGIEEIILGIGGSATNDGGAGMAQALGYSLLNEAGDNIGFGGGSLNELAEIKTDNVHPKVKQVNIIVASDVNNPLCGENGASNVFGPQKGATPEMITILDNHLNHYSQIIKRDLGKDVRDVPGAGGAGGLGGGLLAFTNSAMNTGVDIIIEYSGLKEKSEDCDICFTGEGGIDFQTKFGKTPYGVAKTVKSVNPKTKVIAVVGNIGDGIETLYDVGIDSIIGTAPGASNLDNLLSNGYNNIERTTENILRAIL